MLSRKLTGAALGFAMFSWLLSCSDDTTIVQNISFGDQVRVSGELRIWRCMVGDQTNNYGPEHRFGVITKDTAAIIIEYPNGWRDTAYTDTLSRFERIASKGLHQIVVETRYTWCDTFRVYLERDTIMTLDIVYAVLDPSEVLVSLYYDKPADTLGIKNEWEILKRLNSRLGYSLSVPENAPSDVTAIRRTFELEHLWVTYLLQVSSRRIHVIDVCRRGSAILAADTSHTISPVRVTIGQRGYICMD